MADSLVHLALRIPRTCPPGQSSDSSSLAFCGLGLRLSHWRACHSGGRGVSSPLTSLLVPPTTLLQQRQPLCCFQTGQTCHASGPLHLLFLAWSVAFLEYLLGSLSYLRPPVLPTGLPILCASCIPIRTWPPPVRTSYVCLFIVRAPPNTQN